MTSATTNERPATTFVISITPFTASGEFDEQAIRGHFRRLAAAGIGVYVGGSGSGEGYTLSPAESRRLVELAVDELKGKVPVRSMGVEPRTAQQMIDFISIVTDVGVDATQIYSLDVGHAHLPEPAAIERYLRDVLEQTKIPCVISTHQSVGYKIPAELLGALVGEYEQIVGINCSFADMRFLRDIIDAVDGRADIHVGGEMSGLAAMAFGATGFLSSPANLVPELAVAVVERRNAGDLAGCFDAFDRLNRVGGILYGHGGILATKAVLNHLGLPGGYPRLPHLPVQPELAADLATAIDKLGVTPGA